MTQGSRNCAADSQLIDHAHLLCFEHLVFLQLSLFLAFWLESGVFSGSCRSLLVRRIQCLEYDDSPRQSYRFPPQRHAGV